MRGTLVLIRGLIIRVSGPGINSRSCSSTCSASADPYPLESALFLSSFAAILADVVTVAAALAAYAWGWWRGQFTDTDAQQMITPGASRSTAILRLVRVLRVTRG